MDYYKWIYSDDERIENIPGFVFTSRQNAYEMKEEFSSWVGGGDNPNLYVMSGPEPTTVPFYLHSTLIRRGSTPEPLSEPELEEAMAYFQQQPKDLFFLASATEQDIELFHRIVATLTVVLAPGDREEAYFGMPTTMKKLSQNLKEHGFWKTIGDYPGHMAKDFKKKKRKEGDMSFIRDTDSKKKFKERMHLKLGKI